MTRVPEGPQEGSRWQAAKRAATGRNAPDCVPRRGHQSAFCDPSGAEDRGPSVVRWRRALRLPPDRERRLLRDRRGRVPVRLLFHGRVQAMKSILLLAIRLYWLTVPASRRRPCLFRESCSRHVYRTVSDFGFRSGMSALRNRFRQCRPGYSWQGNGRDLRFVARNGDILALDELNDALVEVTRRLPATIHAASEHRRGPSLPGIRTPNAWRPPLGH
jgi:uncharacterized protein